MPVGSGLGLSHLLQGLTEAQGLMKSLGRTICRLTLGSVLNPHPQAGRAGPFQASCILW